MTPSSVPSGATGSPARRRAPALLAGTVAVALVAAACTSSSDSSPATHGNRTPAAATGAKDPTTTTTTSTTTTTTTTTTVPPTTFPTTAAPPSGGAPPTTAAAPPPPTVAEGPVTSPPLPPPGPGYVPAHVTAVGDSVMIDYEGALEQDVPGITVTAKVSRAWTAGQAVIRQFQASGQLGAVVVVGLSTNGPVTTAQFDSMMALLAGASRVVFVNTRVDRTWQTANNAVLAAGVARYPRAVLADWYSLAVAHPGWLYPTQTHLPIGGTGAQALAALVASRI